MAQTGRFGATAARPLVVDFTWEDFTGQLLLGKMKGGVFCSSCVVEIIDPFDGAAGITVGDLVAVARFQAKKDNDPEVTNHYSTEPHYAYGTTTNVYVFLSGAPTTGSGRVIVYLG